MCLCCASEYTDQVLEHTRRIALTANLAPRARSLCDLFISVDVAASSTCLKCQMCFDVGVGCLFVSGAYKTILEEGASQFAEERLRTRAGDCCMICDSILGRKFTTDYGCLVNFLWLWLTRHDQTLRPKGRLSRSFCWM